MTAAARLTTVARREFIQALSRIENVAAAERLRRTVADAARLIGSHPAMGRREPKLADDRYRFWSVSGFPYLMVYLPGTSPPSIVRFVHRARDLGPLLADLADRLDDPDSA